MNDMRQIGWRLFFEHGDGMAFNAYDDYEQGERVQKWLRENGLSILIGIVIGLVIIFGWQQWRKHQAHSQAQAASLYQQVQTFLNAGLADKSEPLIRDLQSNYSGSSYSVLATSALAASQARTNQLDKALVSLDWAQSHASDANLKALVELRKAQAQIAHNQASDALTTLDHLSVDAFKPIAQELRGDALVKLGRPADALQAYRTAQTAQGKDAPQSGALQIKIDDLAVAGKQGA